MPVDSDDIAEVSDYLTNLQVKILSAIPLLDTEVALKKMPGTSRRRRRSHHSHQGWKGIFSSTGAGVMWNLIWSTIAEPCSGCNRADAPSTF